MRSLVTANREMKTKQFDFSRGVRYSKKHRKEAKVIYVSSGIRLAVASEGERKSDVCELRGKWRWKVVVS